MEEGQNILALMMKKKRAEGSLDMPVKKKKKKKPKKQEELIVTVVDPPPEENEFFDAECKAADQQLDKPPEEDAKFVKKVKKLNGIMARLHASVLEMKSRYDQLDIEELLTGRPSKRKISKARAFVKSQVQSKQKFQNRIDGLKSRQQKRKQHDEEKAQKEKSKQKEKQLEKLKKEIEQRKKEKIKEDEQKAKKEQQARKLIERHQSDEYLYEKMEKMQVKRDKKAEAAHQAYLKQRGLLFKPADLSELDIHMRAHSEQLRDAATLKQQETIEKNQQMAQQNLKLLEKIYRGKNYQMAQLQVQDRKLLKLRDKEKLDKVKKYASYVRENFKPEVKEDEEEENLEGIKEEKKEEQSQSDEDEDSPVKKEEKYPQFRKIKRYKFLQGTSCGEIIETVKAPLSERLQRRLGNDYLSHVYSLPKKKPGTSSPKPSLQEISLQSSRERPKIEIPIMPRPKHYSVKISDSPNRKQISNMLQLLKSKDSQLQLKQKYLIKEAGNLSKFEATNANQIHDGLISNIQRKLSLLKQL